MFLHSRAVARLTSGAVTVTLLATGLSGAANAKVAAFPHVTLLAAKAALPAAKTIPGGAVEQGGKVVMDRSGQVGVCNKNVTLHNLGQAAAVYSSKASAAVSAPGTDWALSVAVFATPTTAAAAMKAIVAVERKCPTRQAYKGGRVHIGIHVTASAPYRIGGWIGYRTVERQVIYIGKTATPVTQLLTMVVRSNALVTVVEETTGRGVSLMVQGARRTQVEARLLAALARRQG